MVTAVGLPVVDFQLAQQNQAQLLAQFQRTPSYAQSVAYYQANIGKVKTVDDLMKDPRLLAVALSAFQLEDAASETGIIRKLLSQDPNAKGSLAQQLIDPRFLAFARAFASLRGDGGAAISSAAGINTVLAKYQENQFQIWLSNNDGDPALRQALFFQQTIEDTIDFSDAGKLFAQYQQSSATAQAAAAFKQGIGSITSITQLVNNRSLLDFALTAFNIDPSTVSTDTVQQIIAEGPNSGDPLLAEDPRYRQFAQAFAALAQGTALSQSSIDEIVAASETASFAQLAAGGNSAAVTASLGSGGANTISTLLTDFRNSSGVGQAIAYYQSHIGRVTSVDQLVGDAQLLNVALGAFNLDSTKVSAAVAKQLILDDPNAPASVQAQANALLLNDPDVARFVQAFSALNPGGKTQLAQIGGLYQQFTKLSSVAQAVASYQQNILTIKSVSDFTNNSQVLNFALTAFGIDPSSVSSTTINQILTETPAQQATDPLLTSDPRFAQFAHVFSSLNSDGGTLVHQQSTINSIVTTYQTNLFAQTLATGSQNTLSADFGASGAATVGALVAAFQSSTGNSQAVSYYEGNIGGVTGVSDLVNNTQLLTVALGAFGIGPNDIPTSTISRVLTETPAQQASDPLVTANHNFAKFVQAFGSLNTDHGAAIHQASSISSITASFTTNQFQQSVAAQAEEIAANPVLASPGTTPVTAASAVAAITAAYQANQFRNSIAAQVQAVLSNPANGKLSTIQLLGNRTLSAVTLGALGLPPQTGALDPSQQIQILTNAGFDPKKLLDPKFLNTFIQQFLVNAGPQQGAQGTDPASVGLAALTGITAGGGGTDPGSVALSLLAGIGGGSGSAGGGSSAGPVPLDLSFLANGSSVNLIA
ncbi:MAG TPA: DUF1217 domain-containing protein [Stellaceae bacterium]|nr:DUF1217 domain-containing protein [Stellaceae bacterium]